MDEESSHVGIRLSPRRDEGIPAERKLALVGQFQKLNPPTFRGDEGPEAAEDFISGLEKIFDVLGCNSNEKVLLAEFSLQRGAELWWKASKGNGGLVQGMDAWEVMRRMLLAKYFPYSHREDNALEFTQLTQGDMTVDEYESKFTSLSRYGASMDEEAKARKFELGLHPEVRLQVAPFMLNSYEEIYRRAENIEKALMAVRSLRRVESSKRVASAGQQSAPAKRFRPGAYYQAPRPLNMRPPRPPMPNQWRPPRMNGGRGERAMGPPLCATCGKYHYGYTCPTNETICYQCGKPGHMRRNCPQTGGAGSSAGMAAMVMNTPRPRGGGA